MSKVVQEIQIMNLFALHGLAYRWPSDGMRTKELPTGEPDTGKAREVVRKYRLGLRSKRDDARAALHGVSFSGRWHGNMMFDFSGYYFRDPEWYEAWLKKRIQHRKGGSVGYQGVPQLGIPGQRDHKHRVKQMRLKDVNFRGKTVLDLGCNVGRWCQEAWDRKASRIVGVDDRRIGLWTQVNNWLMYWRIEFLKADLPYQWRRIRKVTGEERFDIVFCMAFTPHMEGGYQPWIAKLTRGLLIFEGDHRATHKTYMADLERDFDRVERMGYATDGIRSPLFHCYKDRPDDSPEAPADESEDNAEGTLGLDGVEPDTRENLTETIRLAWAVSESVSTAEVRPDAGGVQLAASAASGGDGDTESLRLSRSVATSDRSGVAERRPSCAGDGAGPAEGQAASPADESVHEGAQDR